MDCNWKRLSWSENDVGQALVEASRALGWAASGPLDIGAPFGLGAEDLRGWLGEAAKQCAMDLQPTDCAYADLPQVLSRIAPALLALTSTDERRYIVVLDSNHTRSRLLTPDQGRPTVSNALIAEQLSAPQEAANAAGIRNWLVALRVHGRRARRARTKLQRLLLDARRIDGLYMLRLDAGAPFRARLRERGGGRLAVLAGIVSLLQVTFALGGWFILGRAATQGQLQSGWLSGWVLAQLSATILQASVTWLSGALTHEVSTLLKQRMLAGALRLDPDRIRKRGAGRLLALVAESTALETVGLTGALQFTISAVQLASAGGVLALAGGGPTLPALLILWCAVLVGLGFRYHARRCRWSEGRLSLAQSFVANVTGYRTRIVQQPPAAWHVHEDRALERYLSTSVEMDAAQNQFAVFPARGWLLIGVLGLTPALLGGSPSDAQIAIALGGVLQAYGAFGNLAREGIALIGASAAWTRVGELLRAGREGDGARAAPFALRKPARASSDADGTPPVLVLEMQGVSFRHDGSQEPVLRECGLRLYAGERVLLEGASGSGKSTLAALIAGLRETRTGCILALGLDRATLGHGGWLRRVAMAPQFNENFLYCASLAFNLLMSRCWPASATDVAEAEQLCHELGLGPLLLRMPAGMNQIVGETGWQLSHGERSRVFLARALLQRADLVVLDETFAALDPVTLERCVRTALARARTLLVIAHS